MLDENAHLANILVDAVSAIGLGEEALQALGGDVTLNIGGIETAAGALDAGVADIGAENLDGIVRQFRSNGFEQGDGQGVGLFAGGAAGNPDADIGIVVLFFSGYGERRWI